MAFEHKAVFLLLQSVLEAYRTVVERFHSVQLASKELQSFQVLLSTSQTCFLSEYSNILSDAIGDGGEGCQKRMQTQCCDFPTSQTESALKILLGAHYGPYASALCSIYITLAQLDISTHEICLDSQARSDQVPSKTGRNLDSLAGSNEALSVLRKLSSRTSFPHVQILDTSEVVPTQLELVRTASSILYDTAALVFQTGFAKEGNYHNASLTFVQEACGGATVTLLFSQSGSRSATSLKLSFHLDQLALERWRTYLQADDHYVSFDNRQLSDRFWQGFLEPKNGNTLSIPHREKMSRVMLSVWGSTRTAQCSCSVYGTERCKACRESSIAEKETPVRSENGENIELYVIQANSVDHEELGKLSTELNCSGKPLTAVGHRESSLDSSTGSIPRFWSNSSSSTQKLPLRTSPGFVTVTKSNEMPSERYANLLDLLGRLRFSSQEPSMLDQLHLAHNVASTVVQFYSTPFIEEEWSLEKMGVINPLDDIYSDEGFCLDPSVLFLRKGLASDKVSASISHHISEFGSSNESVLELSSCYQSSLRPFYNLGIALLEIAYLQPYNFLRKRSAFNWNTAQKILLWQNPLGKKYQEVVERCLNGDFGVGSHSTVSDIRNAVYTRVVCVLRDMIRYISL